MLLTMECVVRPFPHPNVSSRAPCILIPREVVQRSGETFQKELVSPAGLEPATHSLEGCCSVQLSYGEEMWSGREDSNLRPPAPKAGALPDCATPRRVAQQVASEAHSEFLSARGFARLVHVACREQRLPLLRGRFINHELETVAV